MTSFFAVTQQQWRACVRRMLRCKLACILPPSSLDPRLGSGAGDRPPLNSRERSIGRAHLPYCPRLRRMILERSETVQITLRDTKDGFYLYEVPPSRAARQVIGPRIPRSWLERLDGASMDVVEPDEIESWVSQDLLKTCASVEPVSELDYCQIGSTQLSWETSMPCSPPTVACCARTERTLPADQRTSLPSHKDHRRRVY